MASRFAMRIPTPGLMLQLGWRSTSLMLFLAPELQDLKSQRNKKGGEAGAQRVGEPIDELTIIRVRKFIAAAKVERAASGGRIALGDACFHLCRYSADTLHPSPKLLLDKNDL